MLTGRGVAATGVCHIQVDVTDLCYRYVPQVYASGRCYRHLQQLGASAGCCYRYTQWCCLDFDPPATLVVNAACSSYWISLWDTPMLPVGGKGVETAWRLWGNMGVAGRAMERVTTTSCTPRRPGGCWCSGNQADGSVTANGWRLAMKGSQDQWGLRKGHIHITMAPSVAI